MSECESERVSDVIGLVMSSLAISFFQLNPYSFLFTFLCEYKIWRFWASDYILLVLIFTTSRSRAKFCSFAQPLAKVTAQFNRKLALVGIIPNHFFSFSTDKDRRTDSRIRRKKHNAAPPGIEPRILRALTTELRSHNGNFPLWLRSSVVRACD